MLDRPTYGRTGTTWTSLGKLAAFDGATGDRFGFSVAVSGTTIVVGAFMDDTPGGIDAGSAYAFTQ
ncbi:MAG TPA: FG-GAP repeat protein [Actinomycetota bacterium]|nr:FG-GAP repeat protein [Actinomycetota bacterium]